MYGETSGQLRDALGVLLRQHRIQQRLGGTPKHTAPETTPGAEREELGKQIRRYRQCVLTWSLQAVQAANPPNHRQTTSRTGRDPQEKLRSRIADALASSDADLATGAELATPHPLATVDSWRRAARAAALGEHDFPAGVGHGRLSEQQRMTVLKDAADVVRGLVALDRRYAGVPGWTKLHNQGWLGRAAEACAAQAQHREPDYTVDRLGWHPPPQLIGEPARPGLAGVIQAQHNLLLCLHHFPDAHSLRIVMDSQRIVTHETSLRIADVQPDLAMKWTNRTETYTKLIQATRDLGGLLGGGNAAGQGAIAASRAQSLNRAPLTDSRQLHHLDLLFTRIDQRVRTTVEHGVRQRLYFLRLAMPDMDPHSPGIVKTPQHAFVPLTSPVRTDLIPLVRHELCPPPVPLRPPPAADQSRTSFEAAITHRPGEPGPTLGG